MNGCRGMYPVCVMGCVFICGLNKCVFWAVPGTPGMANIATGQ